ncbi:hypothetical protein DPMN_143440 [Dreissena polymorpha]|uniref:Uncharacterized protein n=1 Tax=Dreissena polymorpha TaxID=45954 RepID=A0A9D4JN77_DREPO|nr:hypothetical protein DPMN_143440 [Dreissena polymorpha]
MTTSDSKKAYITIKTLTKTTDAYGTDDASRGGMVNSNVVKYPGSDDGHYELTEHGGEATTTNTVFDKKLKERYGENSSLKKKNKKLTEDNKRYSIELMELKALRTANHQTFCKKKAEKEDALTRLKTSEVSKLNDSNPNVVDLHDMKRPTDILVTMMEELYKNEWTDAFLELKKDNPDSNEETNIAQELLLLYRNPNTLLVRTFKLSSRKKCKSR